MWSLWIYNLDTENVEEKRRRSSTQPESKPSVDNENMTTKPVSQAENVHSEAEGRAML